MVADDGSTNLWVTNNARDRTGHRQKVRMWKVNSGQLQRLGWTTHCNGVLFLRSVTSSLPNEILRPATSRCHSPSEAVYETPAEPQQVWAHRGVGESVHVGHHQCNSRLDGQTGERMCGFSRGALGSVRVRSLKDSNNWAAWLVTPWLQQLSCLAGSSSLYLSLLTVALSLTVSPFNIPPNLNLNQIRVTLNSSLSTCLPYTTLVYSLASRAAQAACVLLHLGAFAQKVVQNLLHSERRIRC